MRKVNIHCRSSVNNSVCASQIIGPLEEEEVFNQDDFLLLENIILKTSGERIKSKVQQFGIEEDRYFTVVSATFTVEFSASFAAFN